MTGIDFQTIKQGSQPRVTFIWPLLETHEPQDFTGMTISATIYDTTTQLVTAVTGAIAVVDGQTREIEWQMSELDTGKNGRFLVTFQAVGGGETILSLFAQLEIEDNPAVDAVSNPPLVGVPVDDANWLSEARSLNDPPQTWADLGFDALSNVLVVDAGFDENTPGWSVTAFPSLSSALVVSTASDLIVINGILNTASLSFSVDTSLLLLANSVFTIRNFVIEPGVSLRLFGTGEFVGVENSDWDISLGAASKLYVRGITIGENITITTQGGSDTLVDIRDATIINHNNNPIGLFDASGKVFVENTSITASVYCLFIFSEPDEIELHNCQLTSDTPIFSVSQIENMQLYGCDASGTLGNVAINPLNHSNTIGGATYREVVAVATLPLAADNPGAMAATSDGGTGGIPALMYSNGTAWVVAA